MRCVRAKQLIAISADGTIFAREERSLSEHISRCPHCARYSEDMAFAVELLNESGVGEDPQSQLSPAFSEKLHAALQQEPVRTPRWALGVLERVIEKIFSPYAPAPIRAVRALAVFAALWLAACYLTSPLFAPAARTFECQFGHLASFTVRTTNDGRVYASINDRSTIDRTTLREVRDK